jgi:hypothetical protein
MEEFPDFGFIAKTMIQSYGNRVLQVIERRVADRSRDGKTERARFWWRVGLAVREIRPDAIPID